MNLDLLRRQYDDLIIFKLQDKLLNKDCINLRVLIRFLKEFYKKCPPEQIEEKFVVMVDDDLINSDLNKNNRFDIRSIDLYSIIQFPAVIQLCSDGNIFLWNKESINLQEKNMENKLAYELSDKEYIWIGQEKNVVEASALNTRSYFSNPTYWDLDAALNNYYISNAKKAMCSKISNSWTCCKRMRWKSAPESNLRDSLWEYLKITLRGASEVKREQNVNAENPIDIKVIWNSNFARALIEIKWLGVSVDESETRLTSDYTNSRAIGGADQLCDYIDTSKEENNELYFKGYLVLFDGRRRKVRNLQNSIIPFEDANYYYDKEITGIPQRFINYKCEIKRFFIEPETEIRRYSS